MELDRAYLGSSGSFDKPAVAGQLGVRLRVSKHWAFGLDGEWNPWISMNNSRFGSGVFILIFNPLSIALPVPQLRGVPLTYPQYRMSIGFEVYGG